jgi:hypothetical protein
MKNDQRVDMTFQVLSKEKINQKLIIVIPVGLFTIFN